jgi:hypothetical protein
MALRSQVTRQSPAERGLECAPSRFQLETTSRPFTRQRGLTRTANSYNAMLHQADRAGLDIALGAAKPQSISCVTIIAASSKEIKRHQHHFQLPHCVLGHPAHPPSVDRGCCSRCMSQHRGEGGQGCEADADL